MDRELFKVVKERNRTEELHLTHETGHLNAHAASVWFYKGKPVLVLLRPMEYEEDPDTHEACNVELCLEDEERIIADIRRLFKMAREV